MVKKILITGAAGLIGREMCKQLSSKYDVLGVDNNFRFPNFKPECNYIKTDLNYFLDNTKNNFDYVFHMSAINGTKYFYEMPNRLLENNITGDLAIFNFVKTNPKTKLIYASSSEIVAGTTTFPTPELKTVTIENIHNPRWSYRLGKLVSENYLINSNIDYLIIRFFNVFGESSGAGHFVRDILDKIEKGDNTLIGADETRSFCYVEDAVDAVLAIFDKVSRDVVNVGSSEEITILEAATLIAQHKNKDINWISNSNLSGSVKRRIPDLTKLLKHYPTFNPITFREAIKKL